MATAEKTETPQLRFLKALAHETRLKILGVLSYRNISPAEFARENRMELSTVAYHFRKLKAWGFVEVADTRPARGSTEHFHRGTRQVVFDDDLWKTMPPMLHQVVSGTILEDLLGRISKAFTTGTFDARLDRHFTWTPMTLDEQGWEELTDLLKGTFERIGEINGDASERLSESGETSIEATAALLGFESPKQA